MRVSKMLFAAAFAFLMGWLLLDAGLSLTSLNQSTLFEVGGRVLFCLVAAFFYFKVAGVEAYLRASNPPSHVVPTKSSSDELARRPYYRPGSRRFTKKTAS